MPGAFINLYNKRKFHKRNVCKNNYLLINVLFLNTPKKNYLFREEKHLKIVFIMNSHN